MPNKVFDGRNKAVSVNAAAISIQCSGWVRQMALPHIAEQKTKGALRQVSERSGLTYSKIRRLYYGLTDHILAYERERLRVALASFADEQIKRAEANLAQYRQLAASRELIDKQLSLDL